LELQFGFIFSWRFAQEVCEDFLEEVEQKFSSVRRVLSEIVVEGIPMG
jgi:hypothetical protein